MDPMIALVKPGAVDQVTDCLTNFVSCSESEVQFFEAQLDWSRGIPFSFFKKGFKKGATA